MQIGIYRISFGCILLLAGLANYVIDTHVDCSQIESKELIKPCNDFQIQNYLLIKIMPIIMGGLFIGVSFINPNTETIIKDRTSKQAINEIPIVG